MAARSPVADVELNGEPYALAKPPFGLRLGFQGKEPGSPGAVGTIEIPSFHLGPGEFSAQAQGRFLESRNVEVSVPGQVGRVGASSSVSAGVFETPGAADTVTFDAASVGVIQGSASITHPHTVGAGTDRLLLAHICVDAPPNGVETVTYAGQALTKATEVGSATGRAILWYLVNPPTGLANVVATFPSSGQSIVLGVTSWSKVDQTAPLGTPGTASGVIGTNPSVSVPSGPNEVVVDVMQSHTVDAVAGPGQTQRFNLNVGGAGTLRGTGSSEPGPAGAGNVTMTWTNSPLTYWAIVGVSIKPVRNPGSVPSFYTGGMVLVTKADGAAVDRIVMVSPKLIRVFAAGADGSSGLDKTPAANTSFTGSVAKHKGLLYFPIEGDTAHATPRQAVGMARYHIKNHTFAAPGDVANAANFASRVVSSRNTFWWVQNKGLGGVPEIRAHPDPTDPPPANVAGPFSLSPGNYCTGLLRFGYWVRVAMADGNLHGIDEEGINAPFLPEVTAVPGTQMGSLPAAFLDRVAVAAPTRIYGLDLASLEVADITPSVLQQAVDWEPVDNAPALFSDGVELWAAVHDVGSDGGENAIALWRLMQYPDGQTAWSKVAQARPSGTAGEVLNAQAMLIWDAGPLGRYAYILCQRSSTTTGLVVKLRLPKPGNAGSITSAYETANALLRTPYYRARSMVTAKYLQVRGFQRTAPALKQSFQFEVDGAAAVLLGDVTTAGPFSLPFPATVAALGRMVRLALSEDPGHLALPLFIDYFEVPSSTDEMTIDLLAADNVVTRRGTVLTKTSRLGIVNDLRALKHTFTTISFLDTLDAAGKQTTWTVFIIDVLAEGHKQGGEKPEEAIVSLHVRRV